MRVDKIIETTEETVVEFKDITLLSLEEYKKYKDFIPSIPDPWWLQSHASFSRECVAFITEDNKVRFGISNRINVGVRPVIKMTTSDLNVGDKFCFVGYTWTVIADEVALCDNTVGQTVFRNRWEARDSGEYEKSDIKKWLEKWCKKNKIDVFSEAD